MTTHTPPVVTIQRLPWATLHLVAASGGPEDGSLVGFSTLCGLRIQDVEGWTERPERSATCKRCWRVKTAADGRN